MHVRSISRSVISLLLAITLIIISPVMLASCSQIAIELTILSLNDFHGALVESDRNPGIAKLGSFLKAEIRNNPDGTMLLSAGDMFQGSMESNVLRGKPVVEAMNEIGFHALTVGNHEFDWGKETLQSLIGVAKFPYLGANVIDRKTGKTVSMLQPYAIIKRKGIKIGIIGIATPETSYKTNPKVVGEFDFADPAQIVNAWIPQVRNKGADVIVVLSHLGCAMDENGGITGEAADFARKTSGVDILITGHSHQRVMGKVNGVTILQAGSNGQAVSRVQLAYSPISKQIISSVANVVEVRAAQLEADSALKEMMGRVQREIEPIRNEVVGKAIVDLQHDRRIVSPLGQWSADVIRQSTHADIGFHNGGGLRAHISAGDITMGKLYEVMPFDNTVYVMDLTGEQILQVLRHGIYNPQIGMLQFSGINVRYDHNLPPERRITAVTMPDGSALEPGKLYRVATTDFMVAGGDGYMAFKAGQNGYDTGMLMRDVLKQAVKTQKVIRFTGDRRFIEAASVFRSQIAA